MILKITSEQEDRFQENVFKLAKLLNARREKREAGESNAISGGLLLDELSEEIYGILCPFFHTKNK